MPQTRILLFRRANGEVPLTTWMDDLEQRDRKAHARCLERILALNSFGYELRRPLADTLRDDIHELRIRHGNTQLRILYFFRGRNTAVLSHGFQKAGRAVPRQQIQRALQHKALIEDDPSKYTVEWDL